MYPYPYGYGYGYVPQQPYMQPQVMIPRPMYMPIPQPVPRPMPDFQAQFQQWKAQEDAEALRLSKLTPAQRANEAAIKRMREEVEERRTKAILDQANKMEAENKRKVEEMRREQKMWDTEHEAQHQRAMKEDWDFHLKQMESERRHQAELAARAAAGRAVGGGGGGSSLADGFRVGDGSVYVQDSLAAGFRW